MQFKNKFKGRVPTEIKSNKYEYYIFFRFFLFGVPYSSHRTYYIRGRTCI